MKVAYFDLGYSREQYGLQPTRYGGGAVLARYMKEDPEVEFHIFGPAESFENLGPGERVDRCASLPDDVCDALRRGATMFGPPMAHYWNEFDLILHPHTCATLNRGSYRGPIVHFCGFGGDAGHPGNDYILLYDPTFRAQFGERAKYVTIGKPVPAQCPTKPSSSNPRFVFQCSRHDDHMNSVALAKESLRTGIPTVFAGPIHPGCKLMDYIDGVTTRYLGEITEGEKLDWCRRATLFSILYAWDPPFSQSIIEAQGQGTPIYVPRRGPFLNTYLQHDVNGFNANVCSLQDAFDSASRVDYSQACWRAAKAYDVPVMLASFKRAFREIVEEWKKR